MRCQFHLSYKDGVFRIMKQQSAHAYPVIPRHHERIKGLVALQDESIQNVLWFKKLAASKLRLGEPLPLDAVADYNSVAKRLRAVKRELYRLYSNARKRTDRTH